MVFGQLSANAHPTATIFTELTHQKRAAALETDDEEFVTEAAQGAWLEVKLGELAKTNASAKVVKDFGKMMIADHSNDFDELKSLAKRMKITIPSGLSKKGQREYDKLAKVTGHEFDKEYMDAMVEDHNVDIDEFSESIDESKDANVKAWIVKSLPTLRHHLDLAKSGYAEVK